MVYPVSSAGSVSNPEIATRKQEAHSLSHPPPPRLAPPSLKPTELGTCLWSLDCRLFWTQSRYCKETPNLRFNLEMDPGLKLRFSTSAQSLDCQFVQNGNLERAQTRRRSQGRSVGKSKNASHLHADSNLRPVCCAFWTSPMNIITLLNVRGCHDSLSWHPSRSPG